LRDDTENGLTAKEVSSSIAPPPLPAVPSESCPEATPPVLPIFFCTVCGNIIPADQLVRITDRAVCANCKPHYIRQTQEGVNAPVRVPIVPSNMAGFEIPIPDVHAEPGTRLIAHILDLTFVGAPVIILWMLFLGGAGSMINENDAPARLESAFTAIKVSIGVLGILTLFWIFLYWTWFLGHRGATPGMKVWSLKMVRADGRRFSFGNAFVWALLMLFNDLFAMGIPSVTAFFDREKRTVMDMICGTRVLRR
jgi:uncharacterized RDD family membrane protein YckC